MGYYRAQFYYSESSLFNFSVTRGVRFLILLNFAIFIVQLLLGLSISILISTSINLLPTLFSKLPVLSSNSLIALYFGFYIPNFLRGMIWQPITYQFLHMTLSHLFFNTLWLFVFGPEVELYLGRKKFYIFYIVSGSLAVLANFVPYVLTGNHSPVIGASGSVMAVLMAFAYLDPEREFFLFPLPIPINARGIVLLVIVLNLVYALGESNQSVITHLLGLAVGYLFILLEYRGYLYKFWRMLGIQGF